MKLKKISAFILLFFIFFPSPAVSKNLPQVIINNKNNTDKNLKKNIEKIVTEVKNIRKLNSKYPLKFSIKNKNELNNFLEKTIKKEYPDEMIKRDYLFLKKFGLINNLKLSEFKPMLMDIYSEQVAGLYDSKEKELFLIQNSSFQNMDTNFIIAHELVHSLQDQNFGIDKFIKDKSNSDTVLAKMSLIEGEATLVSMQYLLKMLNIPFNLMPDISSPVMRNALMSSDPRMSKFNKAPIFFKEQMLFPYFTGMGFVSKVKESLGSWDKFNNLYLNPPLSTEQIIHPEKYLNNEKPVKISLNQNDFVSVGRKLIYKDTLGEFFFYTYFLQHADLVEAVSSSSGWGGDSLCFYTDKSDNSFFVLKTIWDTEKDSKEFFDSYVNSLEKRYGKDYLKVLNHTEKQYQANSSEGRISIFIDNKNVNIAEGFSFEQEDILNKLKI